MASYLVKTPGNPDYAGKVFGIAFANGRAVVSPETVNPKLGWTADQIAFSMKNDFGYEVLELATPAHLPYQIPEGYELIPKKAVNAEVNAGALVVTPPEPAPENVEPESASVPAGESAKPKKARKPAAKKPTVRNAKGGAGKSAEEPKPEPEPEPPAE